MFKHLSNLELAAIADSICINEEDGVVSPTLLAQTTKLWEALQTEIRNRTEEPAYKFIEKHSPYSEVNGYKPH